MLTVNLNYIKLENDNANKSLLVKSNFILNNNSIYTILGNNGSGKSSLLLALVRMLNNNFDVDASVSLDDFDLYKAELEDLNKFRTANFRLLFQDPSAAFDPLRKMGFYFNLTNATVDEIQEELKYFQLPKLSELKKYYPYELSVGMLQRVSIILALLCKPKVMLMDEPTSALDLPIINLLTNRLKEYVTHDKRIILLVTQDISFVRHVSSHIAKLSEGRLSNFLPPTEYLK